MHIDIDIYIYIYIYVCLSLSMRHYPVTALSVLGQVLHAQLKALGLIPRGQTEA